MKQCIVKLIIIDIGSDKKNVLYYQIKMYYVNKQNRKSI